MDVSGSNLVFVNAVQHHDVVMDRLWELVQSKDKVDFRVAGSGRMLEAHQLILGLFFAPEKLLNIAPQHWQGSSLDFLMEFVYLGTVSVPEKQLDTLLSLASQLDFTMLVEALLSAKNSIKIANSSKPNRRLKIRGVRRTDSPTSGSNSSATLSATNNSSNKVEVVDQQPDDWAPFVPKLEPLSDDDARSTSSDRPQTVNQTTDRAQWDVSDSVEPDVDDETDCNEHLASVSVIIDEEPYSVIKSENLEPAGDWMEEGGTSDEADQSEEMDTHFSDSENGVKKECAIGVDDSDDLKPNKSDEVDKVIKSIGDPINKSKKFHRNLYDNPTTSRRSLNNNKNRGSETKSDEIADDDDDDDETEDVAAADAETRYKCDTCQKVFSYRQNFETHCLIHTGFKPYKCQVCQKSFTSAAYLKKHALLHTDERPYQCQMCRKEFPSLDHLTAHGRTHLNEKPYKCHLCEKSFTTAGILKVHTRTHTGERPFQCQVCQRAFTSHAYLKKHNIYHTGERPYKCEVCSKNFSTSSHLATHAKTHLGEKLYKCQVCENEFSCPGSLKIHTRLHTGEKPYKCPVCSKAFISGRDLKRHTRTYHPQVV